jgi:hypothetical protein
MNSFERAAWREALIVKYTRERGPLGAEDAADNEMKGMFDGAVPVVDIVVKMQSPGLGFDRVELLSGSTFKDASMVVVIPTRGMIHWRAVNALQGLIYPMNQKRAMFFAAGDEVGRAYDKMIKAVLAHEELKKYKYVLTLEDDNIPPPDAVIRLLESIEDHSFDAVSGLYFTKGEFNMPMAYGDARSIQQRGEVDFAPIDIRAALRAGHVAEVNGIAMGCGLWRMELFRELPSPWFVTVADVIPEKGPMCFTQDLFFCRAARLRGKRFGVDLRVKVGHLDVGSGQVF